MSTVSRIFESQEATSTVHRSDMRAKTTVQYIPRVDPERVDWLLKWIDEHVPVKSGTDRRVRMATWMHLYANYKADAHRPQARRYATFPNFSSSILTCCCLFLMLAAGLQSISQDVRTVSHLACELLVVCLPLLLPFEASRR